MKKTLLAILLVMAATTGFSQLLSPSGRTVRPIKIPVPEKTAAVPSNKVNVVYARIEGNDTILIVHLPEVDIDLLNRYYQITDTRQGRRLVNNVRKVYPYAKIAGAKMQSYDTLLANVESSRERNHLMELAEDEITGKYTDELKHLTFSQGAILIRLIDRETGNTSYQVVQELRGKFRAFFYQGFARLWGYDLKSEYDPKNNPEDDEIETIVTLLERGQI
ncbi:MAG: DUF4294 domain-containing protein [Bacteroidales bacterium]|nr:DUF4294 domain-containing protein [Bacteroidales bacterium]